MCFGSCRVTCDNCKPKFVRCPACGHKNMLVFKACKRCGLSLTEDMKDAAIKDWELQAAARNNQKDNSGKESQ